jgi:ATPase family associated with various cellular activities (AAA)
MMRAPPFAAMAPDAASHFRLTLFGTVLRLAELGNDEARPPFVADYRAECAGLWGAPHPPAGAAWCAAVEQWAGCRPDLPFVRLAAAGLTALHRQLIATIALIEEDPRFALLVEPDGGFPTLGGLIALWRGAAGGEGGAIRDLLLEMIAAGFVTVADPQAARVEWQLRLAPPLHDLLAGAVPRLDGGVFEPLESLPGAEGWVGDADPAALAAMLAANRRALLLVRGPRGNGRKTLLRVAARMAGLNVLALAPAALADQAQWRMAGTLALAGNALVLAELQPGPGETIDLPTHPLFTGPIGVVTGTVGAVRAPGTVPTVGIRLTMPDAALREAHWRAAGLAALAAPLAALSLTSGNIRRAAAGAASRAALAGRASPEQDDVVAALRDLRDAGLDALATPIDRATPPEPLHLDAQDAAEFEALLLRCRHREQLGEPGGGRGVRALFAGPSGTGKTLAARHIAAALGKDLYRIDLAATVSKFIGETEKSLERALSAAEALNIVLLLDEGDALMARRTDVSSANDRYANLETNFLLQRIETFDGILLVTSNDAERIDPAFSRRMDAVLAFRPPDEVRRQDILRHQLGAHDVSPGLLQDVACRCALSGGQLRNIALHARLLALDAGAPIGDRELRLAVVREYRKTGDYCPLKLPLAAVG